MEQLCEAENDETVSHPSHSRLEDTDEARGFQIPRHEHEIC